MKLKPNLNATVSMVTSQHVSVQLTACYQLLLNTVFKSRNTAVCL